MITSDEFCGMNKIVFKISYILLTFALVVLPIFVFYPAHLLAAEPGAYVPLEPIPQLQNNSGGVDIASYIPNLVKLIIQVAGALAVIMIVIGGVQYISTDAIQGKSEGKEKIQNALYGLLLAIGAFIILNSVNPGTLSLTLTLPNLSQVTTPPTRELPPGGEIYVCEGAKTIPGHTWCSDQEERNELAKGRLNPVNVKLPSCKDIGETNCTSVYALYVNARNNLTSLKTRCDAFARANSKPPCDITVTGGTEYWLHGNKNPVLSLNDTTNHKPNGNAVDLRIGTPSLDSYITKGGSKTLLDCASGTKYLVDGYIYVNESGSGAYTGAHWHVCY
jgi:hypothetical protein